jgi:hypothetical protein
MTTPFPAVARLVLSLALLAAPVMARADAVLQQILADSARAPVVGFERTTRKLVPEAGNGTVLIDRFTPTSATGGTWQLVSIDGRKPTAREAKAHLDSDLVSVIPGFHRLHLLLGAPPSSESQSGGRTIYRWASLPKGAVVTPGGDISASLSAIATVEQVAGRPMLTEVKLYAAKPFTVRGIARMNIFEVVSRYGPSPGGQPFLLGQTSTSDVKAPFGMGGKRQRQFSFRPLG